MPNPQKGETRKEYLDRCMGDKEMRKKYPGNDQRYLLCNKFWREERDTRGGK